MRPIDCHKAKKAIHEHGTNMLRKDTVLKILDSIPTLTPQNEWISVDEKLPEDDAPEHKVQITVLVSTDREDVKIKNRTYHPARFYYGKFYPERWDWGTFNDDRITHWMPPPKPPGKNNNVPTKAQNEALTIEQLREMDGEPVYIPKLHAWGLVNTGENTIRNYNGWAIDLYEVSLMGAYRHPPEGEANE